MNRKKIGLWVIVAGSLLLLLAQTALAGTQTIDGITFNGPNTHQSCPPNGATQRVTITGLVKHNPPARLHGTMDLWAITNGGNSRTLLQHYNVNTRFSENYSQDINYPPVSQWPINTGTTRELHVDVAIHIIGQDGKEIGAPGFDGQPNMGWDVFCVQVITGGTNTPTPTRTRTRTPTTVTPTRTSTPLAGTTVTATPHSGNGPTETPSAGTTVVPTTTETAPATAIPTPSTAPVGGADFAAMRASAFGAMTVLGLLLIAAGALTYWRSRRA